MPPNPKILRVLVVDDDRDGADTLGQLIEELGHQVHVTYAGDGALAVAITFRPDLMFIDLAMPHIDGCDLVKRFRQIPEFSQTRIIAITGHADQKSAALAAGFDAVHIKPITLPAIEAALAEVGGVVKEFSAPPTRLPQQARSKGRLPIGEARRIRNERKSKALTQSESEAAVCEGIVRFQEEFLGWRSERIHAHFIKNLLVVRVLGALTLAERQLGKSSSPETGRDLIKQVRKQLLELARPMLESLVHEVTRVKVVSLHHDISTATGEEIIVFSLTEMPRFGEGQQSRTQE